MKRSIAFALTLAVAHAGEINLVPRVRTLTEEGAEIKRIAFSGTNEDHHLTLDSELSFVKLQDGIRFTFHRISTATFELHPSPVPRTKPIAPENLALYRNAALALLPAGASIISPVTETADPHPINGWKTQRFTVDYRHNETSQRVAFTYVTLAEGPQILLTTKATISQFDAAIARSDALLRSWHTTPRGKVVDSGS